MNRWTPILVKDVAADTVVQRLAYDAYGRVVVDTRPGFQPFGYAGGLYDPLTGLVRFGARDYDAEAGKWTAKDPVAFAGGSANLYEYAANSPVVFVDPSGKAIDLLLDLGFIGYDLYRLFANGRCGLGENLAALGSDVLGAGLPFVTGLGQASRGARGIRFGQRGVSATFRHGEFAGRTIDEVAAGLRSGAINPNQLPIRTITRDGVEYTLNNRSIDGAARSGHGAHHH